MTLFHHAFVNYDESDEAKAMIDKLVLHRQHECNMLTQFGETALDLAVEHKTNVLTYILAKHKTKFDFNISCNPRQISLL